MGLQLDLKSNKILLDGEPVGEIKPLENDRFRISLNFELDADRAIAALSYFALSLEKTRPPADLEIHTPIEGIEFQSGEHLLLEFTLKHARYKWRFHKNELDTWPREIHGHDYQANLKVDPISGQFFDVTSKKLVGTLNKKKLSVMRQRLSSEKDFAAPFQRLLDSTQT